MAIATVAASANGITLKQDSMMGMLQMPNLHMLFTLLGIINEAITIKTVVAIVAIVA